MFQIVEDCFTVELTIQTSVKYENFKSSSSVGDNASAIEVQCTVVPDVTATEVNQCVTQKGEDKNKQMQCPA